MTCDEIFSLYLRHVSKQVNEQYYKTVLRFVLLYRECLNEYGWLKRREHFYKAYSDSLKEEGCTAKSVDEFDEVLSRLKKEEEKEEQ